MDTGFEHTELVELLPKMRVWAIALTRNITWAEDLVQDTLTKAFKAEASFERGSNLAGWVHRIMLNHFISSRRKNRFVPLNESALPGLKPPQYDRVFCLEVTGIYHKLPIELRQALSLVAVHEGSYEAAAAATGTAVGTLKSRVSRARAKLRASI